MAWMDFSNVTATRGSVVVGSGNPTALGRESRGLILWHILCLAGGFQRMTKDTFETEAIARAGDEFSQ